MFKFLKDPKKRAEFGLRFFVFYLGLSMVFLFWGLVEEDFKFSYHLVAPSLHVFSSIMWIIAAKETLKDLERTDSEK